MERVPARSIQMNRRRARILPLVFAAAFVPGRTALAAVGWTQASPVASPTARVGHSMAYDALRGRVILFGGLDGTQTLNDTYEYDGTTWANGGAPPAQLTGRYFTGLAFDAARGEVVLFGGTDGLLFLDETWTYTGSWTQESPATRPPGRVGLQLAFDSARNVVVVFGGYDGGYFNDVWEWNGTNWTAAASGATGREYPAMCFDAARGRTLVFGGDDGTYPPPLGDVWEYNGAWASATAGPPPRGNSALAYDSGRGRAILFGGDDGTTLRNDTWEYTGSWSAGPAAPAGLTPRQAFSMAYDSARGKTVLFGGDDNTVYLNQTWEYGCATITITPASLPNGNVGAPYSQTLTASGGVAPYTWSIQSGALPPGLALSAGGVISGTPTTQGTYNFTVQVVDAQGCGASRVYSITIGPPGCPTITVNPAALPAGQVGTPYSQTITASGGTAPYTFAVTSGALPTGLTLTPAGILSGTPTTAGTSNFTITATDAAACTGSRAYTLLVNPPSCGTIVLSPATLPAGTVGVAYSQTITASGGTAPYTFAVTAGTLPPGLVLAPTGVLSGVPTTAGSYNFTVTATDSAACTGSAGYTLVINPPGCPTITIAPATLPGGTMGVPYSQTLTASGGAAPYTFSISAGSLPTGLTLTPAGVLSGTPTAGGTFNFTVTATDSAGCAGTRAYSIAIGSVLLDHIVGEGLGQPNANRVRVYTGQGTATIVDFLAYAAGQWGVNVMGGNVNGGTYEEILTGPGPGPVFGPQIRAFDRAGTGINKVNFYAYGTLRYGVNVGSGGLDADAFDEILSGAGPGPVFGPHVRGWNYDNTTLQAIQKISYFAYGTLKFGVNVHQGSVDADAFEEILTAPGPGIIFGPQVRGWNYDGATITSINKINFNAFTQPQYGANVAGGLYDGDVYAEIAATPGPGPTLTSRFLGFDYDGATISGAPGFDTTPYTTLYGGRVGSGDVSQDGREDLLTGAGRDPSATSQETSFDYTGGALVAIPGSFLPFAPQLYGVNVAGGALGY